MMVTEGGEGDAGEEVDDEERPAQLPLQAHYAVRRHCEVNCKFRARAIGDVSRFCPRRSGARGRGTTSSDWHAPCLLNHQGGTSTSNDQGLIEGGNMQLYGTSNRFGVQGGENWHLRYRSFRCEWDLLAVEERLREDVLQAIDSTSSPLIFIWRITASRYSSKIRKSLRILFANNGC